MVLVDHLVDVPSDAMGQSLHPLADQAVRHGFIPV